MKDYICILGRDPKLSVLELVSYCKRKNIQHQLKEYNSRLAVLSLPSPLNIEELGGTVKIAEQTTTDHLIPDSNKINFALTTIDSKDILPALKDLWKSNKIKAMQRYTNVHDIPPSKSKNLDIEIIVYKNVIYRVVSLSNPKKYKERDETRPSFDPKKVISIRLAKILINLSEAKVEVLDPFCGTGTILQEASLMGLQAIGIDISTRDTKKNLEWLGKKAKLTQGNAINIIPTLSKIEAVVTEPYLGPYFRKLPSEQEAQAVIKELEELYKNLFIALSNKVTGKIVIIVPQIRTYKRTFSFNIAPIIEKAGFTSYSSIPSIKTPIFYEKRKSKVERFIYILEPKRKT